MSRAARIAHVDFEPVPYRNQYDLQPGMIVRPRAPDGTKLDDKRWTVERVSGAFTRCVKGGGKHFTSQYWATDSLRPVKFKRTTGSSVAERSSKSAESRARRPAGEMDEIAQQLKDAHGLDALITVARGLGYPDCDTLAGKVSHLNPGLQRMNVGNRLRSWLSRQPGSARPPSDD